jgi:hypothetical protein
MEVQLIDDTPLDLGTRANTGDPNSGSGPGSHPCGAGR